MLDAPATMEADAAEAVLTGVRATLTAAPPSLAVIFQAGERLLRASAEAVASGIPAQRIAVLGAGTIDYLSRSIACAVACEGVFPIIYQAPFGAIPQEVLDPASGLHAFSPEFAVIAPEARELAAGMPPESGPDAVAAWVAGQTGLFARLWDTLGARGCRIVQHLLVPPRERYGGIAERLLPASPLNLVRALNDALVETGRGRVVWVDLERLAADIGMRDWSASRYWFSARLGFHQKHLPQYIPVFRGAWRAASARAKKVLVVDLDNTLWGGVIGDDGVDGLQLGPGAPEGEAFADWQAYLKALAARGVVLGVCSKNAPGIAEEGFAHSGAVLARDDFAAFECSWADKAAGLRRIAETLNLSLESMVFADDNPAECALVRCALPEVAVVELGSDPALFCERLDEGCWFDLADVTAEDLARSSAYSARAQALAGQVEATDLDAYLAGLAMRGRLYRPEEGDIPRLAQLELKTNQFNLTTRRYSETALRGFLARGDAMVLAFRLADRFGDHGLTSTLIAVHEGDTLRIDSWLMSCRIFSRTAEGFMLARLAAIARERGLSRLIGEYIPTPKNGVVADLFPRLGFERIGETGFWTRSVADPYPQTHIAAGI